MITAGETHWFTFDTPRSTYNQGDLYVELVGKGLWAFESVIVEHGWIEDAFKFKREKTFRFNMTVEYKPQFLPYLQPEFGDKYNHVVLKPTHTSAHGIG